MTTTTKKSKVKQQKQPKTVKVSTVIWTVALLLTLIGGFIGGIATRSAYADAVNKEASSQVKQIAEQLKLNQ